MTGPLEGVPLPELERVPDYERGFWDGTRAGELRILQCSNCGLFRHLPTPMCPQCSSLAYEWTAVSGRGFVYSYVIVRHPVHRAIREKEQTPYNVCVIELEEQAGLRICSNVLNIAPEDISIDMPVQVAFVTAVDDPEVVLPVFVPLHNG
jgi:uncharacterized OB-fold protein